MRPQPEKDESVRLRAHANGRRLTGLFAPLETAYTGLLRDAQRGGGEDPPPLRCIRRPPAGGVERWGAQGGVAAAASGSARGGERHSAATFPRCQRRKDAQQHFPLGVAPRTLARAPHCGSRTGRRAPRCRAGCCADGPAASPDVEPHVEQPYRGARGRSPQAPPLGDLRRPAG